MCIMIRILYMSYLAMNRYRDSIINSASIKSALVATVNSASIESASASVDVRRKNCATRKMELLRMREWLSRMQDKQKCLSYNI